MAVYRGRTLTHLHPEIRVAMSYAEQMHAGQHQGDGTPYLSHPLEVASLLSRSDAPVHVVVAGVLHDVLEKTDTTKDQLEQRFGATVTALVVAVSDDERISGYAKRKAALRQQVAQAGDEALALFAADKLSKLRELRREIEIGQNRGGRKADSGRELRTRRLRHYQRSLALLEERLPESPLVIELRDELQSFLREHALTQ